MTSSVDEHSTRQQANPRAVRFLTVFKPQTLHTLSNLALEQAGDDREANAPWLSRSQYILGMC
jgi:hypothetical protein